MKTNTTRITLPSTTDFRIPHDNIRLFKQTRASTPSLKISVRYHIINETITFTPSSSVLFYLHIESFLSCSPIATEAIFLQLFFFQAFIAHYLESVKEIKIQTESQQDQAFSISRHVRFRYNVLRIHNFCTGNQIQSRRNKDFVTITPRLNVGRYTECNEPTYYDTLQTQFQAPPKLTAQEDENAISLELSDGDDQVMDFHTTSRARTNLPIENFATLLILIKISPPFRISYDPILRYSHKSPPKNKIQLDLNLQLALT